MTPKPLKVDPEILLRGGGEMLTAAEDLPLAPSPFMPSGSDPLSLRIIAEVPGIEGPIMLELPAVQADATKTATDIQTAAGRYSATDKALGAQLEQHQFDMAGAQGSSGAGAAQNAAGSQAGQMGQMMQMPMQMAQQAAQLPMQLMGMAAAVPQGIMQGVQGAMQQLGQLGGQLGGQTDKTGADGPTDQGEHSGDEAHRAEYADERPESAPEENEPGAESGQPGGERAPEKGGTAESPSQTAPPAPAPRIPAPTRPAEANDGINL